MFPGAMNGLSSADMRMGSIQRESDLVEMLERSVSERLPADWITAIQWNPRMPGWRPDAVLTVTAPDGAAASSLVEARLELEPRMIDSALAQLERASIDLPPEAGERGAPLIVSRFISPRARDLLEAAQANYADATGNLRLSLTRPAVFITAEGATKNPWRESRELQSLKGRSAARVIRALCDLSPPFGVRELAEQSGAAGGSVSRTLDFLERESLIERDAKRRVTDVVVDSLIRRWSDDFRFARQNDVGRCLEPRGLDRTLERLRGTGARYAITGSFAANAIAPVADPRLLVIYTDDPQALEADLGASRAATTSNLWLATPPDDLPFLRAEARDGLRYAAASQVACDLFDMPGRSPEEAEAILRLLATETLDDAGAD